MPTAKKTSGTRGIGVTTNVGRVAAPAAKVTAPKQGVYPGSPYAAQAGSKYGKAEPSALFNPLGSKIGQYDVGGAPQLPSSIWMGSKIGQAEPLSVAQTMGSKYGLPEPTSPAWGKAGVGLPTYPWWAEPAPAIPGGGGVGGEGGGGGGGVGEAMQGLQDIKWKEAGFDVKGGKAPSWWKGLVPENAVDAERGDVQALMMLNTMIPYLSPEDQYRAAQQLYGAAADAFSMYKSERIGAAKPPYETRTAALSEKPLETIEKPYFTGQERSTGALDILSQMREKTVGGERWKLGPGYTWLQDVITTAGNYAPQATGAGQTKSQYLGFLGALDPLMAQAKSAAIGGVGALGEMLAKPFFSQGQLWRQTQQGGKARFGEFNPLLGG